MPLSAIIRVAAVRSFCGVMPGSDAIRGMSWFSTNDELVLAGRNRFVELADRGDDRSLVEAADCARQREGEGRVDAAAAQEVAAVAPVPLLRDEGELRVACLELGKNGSPEICRTGSCRMCLLSRSSIMWSSRKPSTPSEKSPSRFGIDPARCR